MIDSHCHLSRIDYDMPVKDLIDIAEKEGVEKMLNIACNTEDWDELLNCIKHHKNVYGAIGIHPEYALRNESKFLERLPHIFKQNPKLLALGEIGLDYSDENISPEKQKDLFYKQIQIAHQIQKPIIVHTRDAENDTLNILNQAFQRGELRKGGVIHCFSGSLNLAHKVLQIGFYISISGIVTFKSAHVLRDIVKEIPLDRLLVETDCPWLAPEPFRGYKNQPAYVVKTLEKLAELKKLPAKELDKITTLNFKHLFGGIK